MNVARSLAFFLLLLLSRPMLAELYIEGYVGCVGGRSSVPCFETRDTFGQVGLDGIIYNDGRFPIKPAFVGGIKFGGWLDCADCWGAYLDVGGHRLQHRCCSVSMFGYFTDTTAPFPASAGTCIDTLFASCGHAVHLACMFAYRFESCDWLECCSCARPYVAVGPSVLFVTQRPLLTVLPADIALNEPYTILLRSARSIPSSSYLSIAPGVMVDLGLRVPWCDCLSCDASVRYQYGSSRCPRGKCCLSDCQIVCRPVHHLISGQLGIAYHF